jgi:hypothetical protein
VARDCRPGKRLSHRWSTSLTDTTTITKAHINLFIFVSRGNCNNLCVIYPHILQKSNVKTGHPKDDWLLNVLLRVRLDRRARGHLYTIRPSLSGMEASISRIFNNSAPTGRQYKARYCEATASFREAAALAPACQTRR